MLAYSGKYRTDGNKIIIKVDIAWDETWNGTEQVRYYRIEGDRLYVEAVPQPYANFGGKVMPVSWSGKEIEWGLNSRRDLAITR
jgi:hypothetical protein